MFWCRSSRLTGVFIITLLCGLVLSGCKKEPEQLEPSTSDTNIISSNQVSEAPSEVSQIGEVSNSEKNLPSQSEQKPESENQVPETEVADSETKGPASEEQLIAERAEIEELFLRGIMAYKGDGEPKDNLISFAKALHLKNSGEKIRLLVRIQRRIGNFVEARNVETELIIK